ncbi:hypothetical protein EV200_103366 [Pedobacter psychrotolerans]|uniref:Lipoprotein n=1 Tax=Pedobacter psychrotolerans TaxID=1843235 RepID=A0A4R2HJ64_9SPHI|nr:hypothetical protein [Pedobacter psychrotolerans]TCO27033.1 hypothetical protein EV200_103366 [Pedobacter psychrotolerans]GGE58428.1 hypothetical protein GCM10011413_26070 [Pedobacter psychrotolerans]
MKWCLYVSCIILFSSCVSLKQTKQAGIIKITDLSSFNGSYNNKLNSPDSLSSLWNQLSLGQISTSSDQGERIELQAISKSKIKAILFLGSEQKSELILKGKLMNNYFVSIHKRTIIPIPFIFGKFKNNQFQFALSENNTLQVDCLNNQWGWVFLFLASHDQTRHYEYKGLSR